jgi:hypothetical protein
MLKPRFLALLTVILAAAATRLLPHPPNMTSLSAVALFGGAYFADKRLAFLVPLTALFLSDLVLGFYSHMEVVYLAFLLVVCIGLWLQKHRTVLAIAGASVASSVVFFLVTNFVWFHIGNTPYPLNFNGMIESYVAALPFFRNTVIGDLLYTALLFGGFALLETRFAALKEHRVPQAA